MRRSADRDAAFVAYVAGRRGQLRRGAHLLTGDWSSAEDLVQTTLTKVYLAWNRIDTSSPEGYVRRTMLHAYLDERRRPWSRELSRGEPPDHPATVTSSPEDTASLLLALNRLTARQRATVVLRHWYGLSVQETAAELGCSTGTVRSQTARALAALRVTLTEDEWTEPPRGARTIIDLPSAAPR